MNYNELQWFIFNFHCITSPSKEIVNDFCPFYFLRESLYETITSPKNYLYEYWLTFEIKKEWNVLIFISFLLGFFSSEQHAPQTETAVSNLL